MSEENTKEDVKTVTLVSGLGAAGYLGVGVMKLAAGEFTSGMFETFGIGLIFVGITMLLSFYINRPGEDDG